ncbi:MAG TPA: Ser/Thr and Tyr protein phosphatase [Thermoanaerobaculia bacterium]|nr:Ser/Thr and Tyr protein phosphatase [Thermoanaerobaculia bacterium]
MAELDPAPPADRVRTYLIWSFWIGIAFFGVYPAMNWVTSMRPAPLHLYFTQELAIPFIPQLIWAYLSMYVLFLLPLFFIPAVRMPALGRQLIAGTLVSAVFFLLIPAELGFPREVPAQAPYAAMYARMFGIDRPFNLVPSLHVIYSCAIALACADFARGAVRVAIYGWLAVIVASTLFVHQHHLLDLVSAFAVVAFLRRRYEVNHG